MPCARRLLQLLAREHSWFSSVLVGRQRLRDESRVNKLKKETEVLLSAHGGGGIAGSRPHVRSHRVWRQSAIRQRSVAGGRGVCCVLHAWTGASVRCVACCTVRGSASRVTYSSLSNFATSIRSLRKRPKTRRYSAVTRSRPYGYSAVRHARSVQTCPVSARHLMRTSACASGTQCAPRLAHPPSCRCARTNTRTGGARADTCRCIRQGRASTL